MFPLTFVSNAFVPTQHMPGWLQVVANWNPVSAVVAGARDLWGNPNPSAMVQAWPMQHPVEAALIWSVAILAVACPLAAHFFKKRDDGVRTFAARSYVVPSIQAANCSQVAVRGMGLEGHPVDSTAADLHLAQTTPHRSETSNSTSTFSTVIG